MNGLATSYVGTVLLDVTWGKDRVTERRGRRRKQLLYVLKETRGYRKFKEETIDGTLRRTVFDEPLIRKTTTLKPTILKCPFSAIIPQMIHSTLTSVLSTLYNFIFDNIRNYTTKYFLNKTGKLRFFRGTSVEVEKQVSHILSVYL